MASCRPYCWTNLCLVLFFLSDGSFLLTVVESFLLHSIVLQRTNSSPPSAVRYAVTSSDPEQRRQESLDAGHDPLLSLNLNLDALARARAPERAQELYQRIQSLYKDGYYATPPDSVSFNSVLKAWKYHPNKALEFWEKEASHTTVNVRSYNSFLLCLALAQLSESAEHLLRQMQAINAAVLPDRISWNTVLLSYANESPYNKQAAIKAERLLDEMIAGAVLTDNDASGLPSSVDRDYVPPSPDTISYNTVLKAWADHPDARRGVEKCEYWLSHMPSKDAYSYTEVLKAHCRRGGPDGVERALELFQEMKHGPELVRPNRIVYTWIIKILCDNHQPHRATKLLDEMTNEMEPQLQPDCITYTSLLGGWAVYAKKQSQQEDEASCEEAVRHALSLLKRMRRLSKDRPEIAPNDQTYTNFLKVLANSQLFDSGKMAQRILLDIESTSTIHYNVALDCYAKSNRATKAVDAGRLWEIMKAKSIPCDTLTYNTILRAAATCFGSPDLKQKSLRIGLNAFGGLSKSEHAPNSLTFAFFFKMLRRLMIDAEMRQGFAKPALKRCCEYGLLNDFVLQQAKQTLSLKNISSVLKVKDTNNLKVAKLPPEWSVAAM